MKKRVITALVYVVVIAGLLVMKLLIPTTSGGLEYGALGMDLLFLLVSVFGAYEFLRAVGDVSPAQKWLAIITCGAIIPVFVVVKMITIRFWGIEYANNMGGPALIALLAVGSCGAMATASLMVFDHEKSNLKSTAYAELCILYCGLLSSVGVNINHMTHNSAIAMLFLFITVPMVDTFAFCFGSLFGKYLPLKLAPATSPNKTVIGAVGGVVGGAVGAVAVWLLHYLTGVPAFAYEGNMAEWLVLILVSIPTSIFAQLGDLFESAIKRCCGIKDMGKILPGHGGMLDRFDSTLFATVPVVVCFLVL